MHYASANVAGLRNIFTRNSFVPYWVSGLVCLLLTWTLCLNTLSPSCRIFRCKSVRYKDMITMLPAFDSQLWFFHILWRQCLWEFLVIASKMRLESHAYWWVWTFAWGIIVFVMFLPIPVYLWCFYWPHCNFFSPHCINCQHFLWNFLWLPCMREGKVSHKSH